MKVTLNPIFRSLSGRVGSLVFYQSYGRQYARAYVVPKNPDTTAQRQGRTRFAEAVKAWQKLPEPHKNIIRMHADKLGRTGYNLFISAYLAGKDTSSSLPPSFSYYASPFLSSFCFSNTIVALYEGCTTGKGADIRPPGRFS